MPATTNAAPSSSAIPPEILAELQEVCEAAMRGDPIDPVAAEQAAREMDEGREEIRRRFGELDIAVELIREVRGDS